jgi:hypothetical protein
MKTILSLFDYSGQWPRPYKEQGYEIIRVDIKHGWNIYDLNPAELPTIHGVLAAPPCDHFASSGARWWREKDADGRTFEAIALIYKTLSIIWYLSNRDDLVWWALENPVGRLARLVPELSRYGPFYFDPCDYGDPYTKKTGLWGVFVPPLPLFVGSLAVEPIEGSKMHKMSSTWKTQRSITPDGFARAFAQANP